MRIEVGAEIIFPVSDGLVDLAIWHVPAPTHAVPDRTGRKGRRGRPPVKHLTFAEQVAPLVWSALCGLTGWVYAYGPQAARGRCCPVCLARAPAVVEALPVVFHEIEPVVCVGCGMPLGDYTPACETCWDRRRRRQQRGTLAA